MKRPYLIVFAVFFLTHNVLANPKNSIHIGNTWMCQNGYKKVGETCKKIFVPDNAIAVGSNWMCQNGYKKTSNSCKKIFVPKNAIAIGSTWMCQNEFKKVGNICKQISIPKNAIAVGGRWQCKPAYKRSGNKCIKKTYVELIKTIDWLVVEAYSDSCDNFERSCKANCNTYECTSACDAGKSECDSILFNACDEARSSCISECKSIDSFSAQSLCEDACSSGESSCD